MSKEFFERNREYFNWENSNLEVSHSKKGTDENASKAILVAKLKIGKHSYKSNWHAANCRCDILGIPWHFAHNPKIDYVKRIVKVGEKNLSIKNSNEREVKVLNLSFKKFRHIVREEFTNINVFRPFPKKPFETKRVLDDKIRNCSYQGLKEILIKHNNVFREELT